MDRRASYRTRRATNPAGPPAPAGRHCRICRTRRDRARYRGDRPPTSRFDRSARLGWPARVRPARFPRPRRSPARPVRCRRRSVVNLVLQLAGHIVIGLVEKPDKSVNLVSGLLAQGAYRLKRFLGVTGVRMYRVASGALADVAVLFSEST